MGSLSFPRDVIQGKDPGGFSAPSQECLGFLHPGNSLASLGGVGGTQTPQVTFPWGTLHLWVPAAPEFQLPSGSDMAVTSLVGHPSTSCAWAAFPGMQDTENTSSGTQCIPLSPLGPSHHLHSFSGMEQEIKATGDPEQSFEGWKRGNVFIAGLII